MICDAFTGVFWKLVDYFQNALLACMISMLVLIKTTGMGALQRKYCNTFLFRQTFTHTRVHAHYDNNIIIHYHELPSFLAIMFTIMNYSSLFL